ncbi:MAG: threonine/serine ThrE exporter family protein [Phycisphaerales bacterium]
MADDATPARTDADGPAFLTEMARALAAVGTPAHRLEDAMTQLAASMGYEAEYFATPTAVFESLRTPDGRPVTTLTRTQPSDVNAERLADLDALLVRVHRGQLSAGEARLELRAIRARPDRYGPTVTVLCIALASACGARFFGGGLAEIAGGWLVGLVVGSLALVASQRRHLGRLMEFLSGLVAALGAALFARYILSGTAVEIVTLAGVIALVPGLSLTVAMSELATRNLVAGGARLMGALVVLVSIGFGVAMGGKVAEACGVMPGLSRVEALPGWTELVALGIAPAALAVLFRVPPRFVPLVSSIGIAGFLSARVGAQLLGPELGVCLGAATIGLLANAYSRVSGRPIALATMPGIILLVPGGIGFRSVSSFLASDALGGVQTAFNAFLVAVSLVVGLLLANVAVPPRRAL